MYSRSYFWKAAGQNQTTHLQINQKRRMLSNTQPTKTWL